MSPLPLLPVTTVGSWPRPPELLRAQRLKQTGRLSAEAFERQADVAVLEVLRLRKTPGLTSSPTANNDATTFTRSSLRNSLVRS